MTFPAVTWHDPDDLHAEMRRSFEASGLSESELARRMDVDRRRVNDFLHGGTKRPKPGFVRAWFGALGLEVRVYIGDAKVQLPAAPDLTAEQRNFLRAAEAALPVVKPGDLTLLAGMIDAMARK